MTNDLGREICGNLATAESREWLVTNGIGGYASGTIAGLVTRRYHGLLIAALKPPLNRTLLVTKLDETIQYHHQSYPLYTNRWADGTVDPHGYKTIESFRLEGTIPVWRFACADALLEKQLWMQQGANTTYSRYTLVRASKPITLSVKALVNYRDHHGSTYGGDWQMQITPVERGVWVTAFEGAVPFCLLADRREISLHHDWSIGFDLSMERYRGLSDREDHLHVATFETQLKVGESLTLVVSTEENPELDGNIALDAHYQYQQELINRWDAAHDLQTTPSWIRQLVWAADQFIVNRPLADAPDDKTIMAGYPWFGDWGRDTMISLPGLTLSTGRPEIALTILRTFARYIDQGMLPNLFPDVGTEPEYNTVDATLWYFEAIRAYYETTQDQAFIAELFPILEEVIDCHRRGTRYSIHLDNDGLIYAGEAGVQLTWMDGKIGDWVVTPRVGKPVEINALWYNALGVMITLAQTLGKPCQEYQQMAQQTAISFQRFWNSSLGYCYDVLDTQSGDDAALRPNQIFAVSLPMGRGSHTPGESLVPLLDREQQRSVVDTIARTLLTSYGLRSLCEDHPQYSGHYGGNPVERDSVYHQGTTWAWLIGHFLQAHLRVYNDPTTALTFLEPIANHLQAACVGSISEIFDGYAPMTPRGCFAQAWSVAEVLRAWVLISHWNNYP